MRLSVLIAATGIFTAASAQVKILLLGDSITEISCWRTLVWNQLTAEGLAGAVDFVGSMNNLQSRCTRPANFDPNHEGHSGWQAYDIARNNIVDWVRSTTPDIVQFMLGTNDLLLGGRSTQAILDSYSMIINAIRATNPNAKIIVKISETTDYIHRLTGLQVDLLIPSTFNGGPITTLNNAIPGWVQQYTTVQSPIVIADCSSNNGFTTGMLEDGIHPNLQGDQFIARQIGPLLIQFIRDIQGSPNPSSTTLTTISMTTSTTSSRTLTSTTAAPSGGNCAPLWGQCGGRGFDGPTCCSQGINGNDNRLFATDLGSSSPLYLRLLGCDRVWYLCPFVGVALNVGSHSKATWWLMQISGPENILRSRSTLKDEEYYTVTNTKTVSTCTPKGGYRFRIIYDQSLLGVANLCLAEIDADLVGAIGHFAEIGKLERRFVDLTLSSRIFFALSSIADTSTARLLLSRGSQDCRPAAVAAVAA
ncbi:hypothetical protein S40288_11168 [Stachybotrys chartarum IBT 40288]|nr:hypothetical protein S40288_11168 [Stachybotrys chartarum IBT 40288]